MAETVQDLVTEVLTEGAFDASDAQALRALDRRQKKMAARARAYRKTVSIGPVITGQDTYLLGVAVLEVLMVNVGGAPYTLGTETDIVNAGRGALIIDRDGIMVGAEDLSAAAAVRLWPVPAAGTAIDVHAVLQAPDLTIGDESSLIVPEDHREALVAGAIASLLSRNTGDWRPDLAQPFEQQFSDGCEEWRRQVARRMRGSGPAQIRVHGINA